jgi:CheY-like chemotaxis protein
MHKFDDTSDIDAGARPTPVPSYDLEAYARDSEHLRARSEIDTSPPPPIHPASLPAIPRVRPLPGHMPSSLQSQMGECARRADLLAAKLRVGAVSREEASRILRTELNALEVSAGSTTMRSLRTLVLGLRGVMAEIGGIAEEGAAAGREVLVLDADPTTRALVALALESHGHFAHTAASLADLTSLRGGADFGAIFVAMDFPGTDPAQPFCRMLPEIVRSDAIPVVLYGRAPEARLAAIAERAEADASLRIDLEITDLLAAIGTLVGRLMTAA